MGSDVKEPNVPELVGMDLDDLQVRESVKGDQMGRQVESLDRKRQQMEYLYINTAATQHKSHWQFLVPGRKSSEHPLSLLKVLRNLFFFRSEADKCDSWRCQRRFRMVDPSDQLITPPKRLPSGGKVSFHSFIHSHCLFVVFRSSSYTAHFLKPFL